MLQYLHISGDLLLALNLLVQLSLSKAFDCDEMATELMLGDADLTEGALSQFVAYAIEFDRCGQGFTCLLEAFNDHCDQVLLVFQQGIKHFSCLDL